MTGDRFSARSTTWPIWASRRSPFGPFWSRPPWAPAEAGTVTAHDPAELKQLEGHRVSVALADGSRIDDCELVAVSRGRRGHLWVHANGGDAFLPLKQGSDGWEVQGGRGRVSHCSAAVRR